MTSSSPKYPNLLSRSNFKIDSSLIKPEQLKIIINWIRNEKNINSTPPKNKYTFTLLYKASHDGFQNNTFNNKCASQGSCLVVTKCDETNKIIGGYTSVGFNYNYGYYNDSQSFLFSFNFNEIKKPIICHIQNFSYALYNNYNNGNYNNSIFNFGSGSLSMNNNYISCSNNNYYKQVNLLNNNTNNFNASEIEAFKVQLNS
ncbi:9300_t:CDS:1 [Entrophospora sp. SA101]|nr:9300_t:CDS:1 [Entrophospora sp. SA101]CAJ0827268.1 3344_t:CDS:1 [Entrophospora sp. SA101]CAJ0926182.1 21588_t:CDS:1 [Entrophospora sp. SA101]